jgi:hypothetical protein
VLPHAPEWSRSEEIIADERAYIMGGATSRGLTELHVRLVVGTNTSLAVVHNTTAFMGLFGRDRADASSIVVLSESNCRAEFLD